MTEIACPICRGGALVRGEGKLEQSGDSYLPTAVWSCGCCGYARFEPAVGRRWRPAQEREGAEYTLGAIGSGALPGSTRAPHPPPEEVRSRRAA
jgi:hypothetical protein